MDNKMTEYILKHSRKKDKELKYDFMPSLLEIIERPAHKAGTVIILGVFTLLIAAIIWACLSKIDVVVTSSGSVQPIGNINVVQSYAGGFVKAIDIKEGDYVYYVHSYYANSNNKELIAYSEYEKKIPGIVRKDNVYGLQFHPEKSGQVGADILKAYKELILK